MENSILHNRGTGNEPLTIAQLRYDCKYIGNKQGGWPDEFFGSRNCCVIYYLARLVAKYYSFIQENKEYRNTIGRLFKERIDHFLENIHNIKDEKYIQEDPERYERFKATLEKYQKLYGCQPEVEEDEKVKEDNYVSVYYNSYL